MTLPPEAEFPEGSQVRVHLESVNAHANGKGDVPHDEEGPTLAEWMGDLIGCVEGPGDMAENHDFYAHGAPKRH